MVVFTSEEMEPSSIAAHEVEHKDAVKFDQVAVFDGFGWSHGRARSLIYHQRHRHRVTVLDLLELLT